MLCDIALQGKVVSSNPVLPWKLIQTVLPSISFYWG